MRRPKLLLIVAAIAAITAVVIVPSAAALDIVDTPPPNGQVGTPYLFQFDMVPGSGSEGMTWKISSGSLPPGLSLTYETQRWARVVGTPTTPGTYKFYLQAIDIPGPWVCCTEEEYSITITTKLTVTSSSLPDASINQPYSAGPLTAGGGTVSSWTLEPNLGSLPPGITMASDGRFSGTPTQAGNFTFTVKANGTPNSDTKQLSIFVIAPLELQTLTGTVPKGTVSFSGTVGSPVTFGFKAAGGREPYTYEIGANLPTTIGLTFDKTTGLLTGTPTAPFGGKVVWKVTDATGATKSIEATVSIAPLLAFDTTKKLGPAKVGKRFSQKIPTKGKGKGVYYASGQFPSGLSLDETTGILSGVPTTAGSFKLKISVFVDGSGKPVQKTYTFKVTA